MSYEIHITRRENWFDKNGSGINLNEWELFIATDSELQVVKSAEITSTDGSILIIENEGLTKWNNHPKSQNVWLIWNKGHISCKNPDGILIAKMIDIASHLQARVQGDEGEFYF